MQCKAAAVAPPRSLLHATGALLRDNAQRWHSTNVLARCRHSF